jgi:ferric-dicitrate binding protein FerR (iron transport regulator)
VTPADRDPIAHLLELSGSRPLPAPERTRRARLAVREAWQRQCRSRERRRRGVQAVAGLAGAAAVFAAVSVWRSPTTPVQSPPRVVGQVEIVHGRLSSLRPASGVDTLAAGAALASGAVVEVDDRSRAAVRLPGGVFVRMDRGTRLGLPSGRVLDLERGAVYVESDSGSGAGIEVRTALGIVTDVGTRFESRLEDGALSVRVRDGRAALRTPHGARECAAGGEVAVGRDGAFSERPFAPNDAAWEWTQEVAPPFVLEGSGLGAFLDWTARENGWTWRFADAETARRASAVTLHGSLEGVRPSQALAIVLPASNLRYHVTGGRLTVGPAAPRE